MNRIPDTLSQVGIVSALFIHPIKSCRAVSVERLQIAEDGPIGDRRFMLTDPQGRFLTQREAPELASVQVEASLERLVLQAPHRPPAAFELRVGAQIEVQLWGAGVPAFRCSQQIDAWFQDFLARDCQLAYIGARSKRLREKDFCPKPFATAFADSAPILMVNEASLEQLKLRVPVDRFRANIVIREAAPFSEDGWGEIKIGEVPFISHYACDRCVVTTIDQRSGEKAGREPLATLNLHRKVNNKTYLGRRMVHGGTGVIKIGDPVLAHPGDGLTVDNLTYPKRPSALL